MNLIEMWGYCVEGKHRLLVYEYIEHGSLAYNLSTNVLDWEKRFEIVKGTAKGLAYLHEDCLDWILHCNVKLKIYFWTRIIDQRWQILACQNYKTEMPLKIQVSQE